MFQCLRSYYHYFGMILIKTEFSQGLMKLYFQIGFKTFRFEMTVENVASHAAKIVENVLLNQVIHYFKSLLLYIMIYLAFFLEMF